MQFFFKKSVILILKLSQLPAVKRLLFLFFSVLLYFLIGQLNDKNTRLN